MARPLEFTPVLSGKDAERFLAEKERIENLDPNSREAEKRRAFFRKCRASYELFKAAMD
jgi:hypothetical protein